MEDLKELTSMSATKEAVLFVKAWIANQATKGRELKTNSEAVLDMAHKAALYEELYERSNRTN